MICKRGGLEDTLVTQHLGVEQKRERKMKRAKVACLRILVVQAHPGKRQTPRTVQKKEEKKRLVFVYHTAKALLD